MLLQASRVEAQESQHRHGRPPTPSPAEIAKLPPDGGPKWNRLVFENSPYLLQHAANPVDWYPWGEEAFQVAKKRGKPIFLSIGYATCHWCHVMERESFEDEEVAKLLNAHFVCIKVDREERPDIDDVYMTACQALTGTGGWPLTAMLTHDKKPFFAGTYFPKRAKFGKPGMMELIPQVAEIWETRRKDVLDSAEKITKSLAEQARGDRGTGLTTATLDAAFAQLTASYDAKLGGFGGAPKFPVPHRFGFLLRYWHGTGEAQALEMTERSLQAMRRGGIYDHIGFGFHRYSTDAGWLVPHFEKMLYDQALMAIAYLEAFQATGNSEYAEIAREIFAYVERAMTAPEGGFFSAEDADSEGEEGKFYVWRKEEVIEVLGVKSGARFAQIFNITERGNFHDEVSGETRGHNIPHLQKPLGDIATEEKMDLGQLKKWLEKSRVKLFRHREKRVHPFKDDKILTDWNGLMIAAFAVGAKVLEDPAYARTARKAADFVLETMRAPEGRLFKRYRQGQAGLTAHLADYTYLVWGLLELYEATFEVTYLQEAIRLTDITIRDFWDSDEGGFFLSGKHGEPLILKNKKIYDGALPSGNSVAALNLLKIGRITAWGEYDRIGEKVFASFSGKVSQAPPSFSQLLWALSFREGPTFEIVISGKRDGRDTREFTGALFSRFIPNKVVLLKQSADNALSKIAAYTRDQHRLNGAATVYVCRNFACKKPTTDVKEMLSHLKFAKRP